MLDMHESRRLSYMLRAASSAPDRALPGRIETHFAIDALALVLDGVHEFELWSASGRLRTMPATRQRLESWR